MAKFNLTEESLNRSSDTVAGTPREQAPVCYAITCPQAGMVCGVADIVDLLTDHCQGPLTLRGKSDGERFEAGDVVLTLEGPFGEMVALETLCLGILSLSLGAANMADLVEAAGDSIKVIDTSARHFPPELIAPLAVAAAVGGARGTSTRAGQTAAVERFGVGGDNIQIGSRSPVIFGLYGSVPDALTTVFSGNSVECAQSYHATCPDAPLSVVLGFEGRERDTCSEVARQLGSALEAVRLDTPPDRLHQGGHEQAPRALEMRILSQARDRAAAQSALEKYGFGPGVTVEAVYAIRDLLDSHGARSARIVVGGDFDVQKVKAFRACHAPVDMIETDRWVEFAEFTSRIVRVLQDGQWIRRPRAGAAEPPAEPDNLPVIFQK